MAAFFVGDQEAICTGIYLKINEINGLSQNTLARIRQPGARVQTPALIQTLHHCCDALSQPDTHGGYAKRTVVLGHHI